MKIVQVINSMISNQNKITHVLRKGREFFFLYDNKHKWSVIKAEKTEDYYVHFYPTDHMTIDQLAEYDDWPEFSHFVTFSTIDIKTTEALESFRELYQIVGSKLYGLDEIFDQIIGTDIP